MTKKDLRRLTRIELIELLHAQSREIDQVKADLERTEAELERTESDLAIEKEKNARRQLTIANAGSIAEAVVGLSGIFETAQKAADDYLYEVQKRWPLPDEQGRPVSYYYGEEGGADGE